MKLYVAQRHYDYEGFEIIGIFTDRAAAQLCCDSDCNPADKGLPLEWQRKLGDAHTVEEHELQYSYDVQAAEG